MRHLKQPPARGPDVEELAAPDGTTHSQSVPLQEAGPRLASGAILTGTSAGLIDRGHMHVITGAAPPACD
jgi:hypothetical protein